MTKVVLEALSERCTIQEFAQKYHLHSTQLGNWKSHLLSIANRVFNKPVKDTKTEAHQKEEHFLKVIGQQNMEIDFFFKKPCHESDKSRAQNAYRQGK